MTREEPMATPTKLKDKCRLSRLNEAVAALVGYEIEVEVALYRNRIAELQTECDAAVVRAEAMEKAMKEHCCLVFCKNYVEKSEEDTSCSRWYLEGNEECSWRIGWPHWEFERKRVFAKAGETE